MSNVQMGSAVLGDLLWEPYEYLIFWVTSCPTAKPGNSTYSRLVINAH
jgi:hypothetical protein